MQANLGVHVTYRGRHTHVHMRPTHTLHTEGQTCLCMVKTTHKLHGGMHRHVHAEAHCNTAQRKAHTCTKSEIHTHRGNIHTFT